MTERLLNRMKKLELCLIPEVSNQLTKTTDISEIAHLRLKLDELRLEYRENAEQYADALRKAREETDYTSYV